MANDTLDWDRTQIDRVAHGLREDWIGLGEGLSLGCRRQHEPTQRYDAIADSANQNLRIVVMFPRSGVPHLDAMGVCYQSRAVGWLTPHNTKERRGMPSPTASMTAVS